MKKKTFIVQLLDSKKPNRKSFTQVEDANFYSNDTDASLVFIPHEDAFDFQTAKVVMYNRGDKSLVERDAVVTTEDGRKVASYELPADIIAHWGDWTAQPVFISGGETYSGSIVPFSVFRYLMHERPPKLNEIVTVTNFIQQSEALVNAMEQEEAQRVTQEQARQIAEQERVQGYQEIKQIIADGALNAEPADGSITTNKLAGESVTPDKTSFLTKGKNLFNKDDQTPFTTIIPQNGNITVSSRNGTSEPIHVKEQTDYFMSDTQGSTVIVAFFKSDKSFISSVQQPGDSKFTTPPLTNYLIVAVRDDKWETFQIEEGSVGTPYQPFKYELDDIVNITIDDSDLLKSDRLKKELFLENGSIGSDGTNAIGPNRVRSFGLIDMPAGSSLTIKEPDKFQVAVYDESGQHAFSWGSEKLIFEREAQIRIMLKAIPQERLVTVEEAKEQIIIRSPESIALLSDLSGNVADPAQKNDVKYVSLTGSDSNSGDTLSTGYATLQKAVEEGASTVYVERGIYYGQRFTAQAKKLTILPANTPDYAGNPVEKIKFVGAIKLNDLSNTDGILSQSLGSFRNAQQVFLDKTLPVIGTGARPQYNVLIWETFADFKQDYVMKPVLTMSEMESENGTFFWDGSTLYINPTSVDSEFYIPTVNVGLDFSNVRELEAVDLVADFNIITPFNLDGVTSFDLKNCEANHSGLSDGFSVDFANGTFENCLAYKNRNDGFNMHFHGDTTLINCYGSYNYDDGVSHHEHTTGVVIGGEFSYNGKAGSAPVTNAKINMYDVWLEGNDYGILSSRASERNIYKGNVIQNNRVGISNNVENTLFVDNKLIGNETEIVGTVEQI